MTHSSTYTLLDDDIFSERHLLNILLTRLDMVLLSSTYVQRRMLCFKYFINAV